jgi:transcriptional regulator with XRE-family HTH domain
MPARQRQRDLAIERARSIRTELGRSLRVARLEADLSIREVGQAADMSTSQASRIERSLVPSLTFEQAMRLGVAVGLNLSAKFFPAGDPIRDAAHVALIDRMRVRLHPSLVLLTEVPLPIAGDRRAWDAVIRGLDWHMPVEAETRPRDMQALDRRIALKLRDSGFENVILLLLDSAANRRLLRSGALPSRFVVDGRSALARLARGQNPGGSAVVLL